MSFRAIVAYPHDESSKFDIEYYLSTHMPLVEELFKPFGLQRWEVIQFAGEPGSSPEFAVQTILFWQNADQVKQANASEGGKRLVADIANFSKVMPVALAGNVVGQSKL